MRISIILLIALIGLIGVTDSAYSGETDNFLAWGEEIKDSADIFNTYLNNQIDSILKEHINSSQNFTGPENCRKVALVIMRELGTFGGVIKLPALSTDLEIWAEANPRIDRIPKFGTPVDEYVAMSIYTADMGFLEKKFVSIDPTINIGGIYLGTDKLSHFLGSGYLYFKTYSREMKITRNETIARKAAIENGCRTESGILGMMTTGVFSFADLEANYQGLVFALDLCRPNSRILSFDNNQWQMNQDIDIRTYVNPHWDETENTSAYTKKRWEQIRFNLKILKYCNFLDTDWMKERERRYDSYELRNNNLEFKRFPSFSYTYLKELQSRESDKPIQIPNQTHYSICSQKKR